MSEQQLRDLLTRLLHLSTPRFELEKLPGGKLAGSVISDTFVGMSDSERQKVIWDALENELGAQATLSVSSLLAYTDAEWNVDLAET